MTKSSTKEKIWPYNASRALLGMSLPTDLNLQAGGLLELTKEKLLDIGVYLVYMACLKRYDERREI